MGRIKTYRGEAIQGDDPNWEPLLETAGHRVVCDFMWMFEVELSDGRRLQAYKHIDTRGYVHLDADGNAFAYQSPNRYRPIAAVDAFVAVFASLPGLAGVDEEQIRVSWWAVDRVEQRTAEREREQARDDAQDTSD